MRRRALLLAALAATAILAWLAAGERPSRRTSSPPRDDVEASPPAASSPSSPAPPPRDVSAKVMPTPVARPAVPDARLSGRVFTAAGLPAKLVGVFTRNELTVGIAVGSRMGRTDREGEFDIPLESAARWLFVWAPGHEPVARALSRVRTPVEIRLPRAIVIAGLVVDDRGVPVEGATVAVTSVEMRVGGARGRLVAPNTRSWELRDGEQWVVTTQGAAIDPGETTTGEDGAFVLRSGLRDGRRTHLVAGKLRYTDAIASWRPGDPTLTFVITRHARLLVTASDSSTGNALPRFEASFGGRTRSWLDGVPVKLWVPPGRGSLRVRSAGYRTETIDGLRLAPGEKRKIDAPLLRK